MVEFDGFLSSGSINPSRFVSISSGNRGYVFQSTASTPIVGVSCEGTFYPPGTAADTGLAGVDGLPVRVYAPARTCLIKLGGTVSAGDRLVADASGQGTKLDVTATGHQYIGGIVLDNGVSGGLVRMFINPFEGKMA
jgi:hypothetical protein